MESDVHEQLITAVGSYNAPRQAIELLNAHPPLLIAGVTAAGKDTVAKKIVQAEKYRRIVTHTTRQMRPGERNGENYWFATETEMLKLIKTRALVDVKIVHQTTIYGATIAAFSDVISDGLMPLWVVDVQGVSGIIKHLPSNVRPVFILPPDFQTWLRRMEKQGTVDLAERKRRLHSAKIELEEVLKNEKYLLFVNDEVSVIAGQIISKGEDDELQHHNRQVAVQLLNAVKDF